MNFFDFSITYGPKFSSAAMTTAQVFVYSALLAVIISIIFGIMRLSKNIIIQVLATVYIEFYRGTSLIIQMFWIYYVLPLFGLPLPALLAGVLALGMNFGAYGAEVLRAGILAVPKGQWEGALALNFSKAKRMQRIIIPQILSLIHI